MTKNISASLGAGEGSYNSLENKLLKSEVIGIFQCFSRHSDQWILDFETILQDVSMQHDFSNQGPL